MLHCEALQKCVTVCAVYGSYRTHRGMYATSPIHAPSVSFIARARYSTPQADFLFKKMSWRFNEQNALNKRFLVQNQDITARRISTEQKKEKRLYLDTCTIASGCDDDLFAAAGTVTEFTSIVYCIFTRV